MIVTSTQFLMVGIDANELMSLDYVYNQLLQFRIVCTTGACIQTV